MTYISIPVEIEAIQFTPATLGLIPTFTGSTSFQFSVKEGKYQCLITVNNGVKLLVIEDDYIIKDKNGNISIMKPDVFEKTYILKE